MLFETISKKKNQIMITHLTVSILLAVLLIYLIIEPRVQSILPGALTSLFLLFMIFSILNQIIKLKKSLIGKEIILISTDASIPYPSKFKCKSSTIGKIVKSYGYKNHQIPESFVEFMEGRTVYLYKKADQDEAHTSYKIIDIHHFKYVLIEDETKKKKITHLKNIAMQ